MTDGQTYARTHSRRGQSGKCPNMEPKRDLLLTDLLKRWHLWANAPVRRDDTLLRDFDALVSKLSPRLLAAVSMMARNAASGASVWSSHRVDAATARRARAHLRELLEPESARWFGPVRVKLNERGNRIGESNPRAEVSDHEVELALELREQGFSLSWLAQKFEVHKATIQGWVSGRRRGQAASRVKEV
jgi:hypothetical protein